MSPRTKRRPSSRRSHTRRRTRPGRRGGRANRSLLKTILLSAVGAVSAVAIIVTGLVLQRLTEPAEHGTTISIAFEADDGTVAPSTAVIADAVDAAIERSADGAGQVIIRAIASGGVTAATFDLAVERDNRPETDPAKRADAIDERFSDALEHLVIAPGNRGDSALHDLIASVEGDRPTDGSPWLVFFVSNGLSTHQPIDVRELMDGEPAAAAERMPEEIIADLTGAEVTFIVPGTSTNGSQDPLNVATAHWRNDFVQVFLERANPESVTVVDRSVLGEALPSAPSTPPVPNIELMIDDDGVVELPLNAGALFNGNEWTLVDEVLTKAQLADFAATVAAGDYTVRCEGHTSAQPPDIYSQEDITLSMNRATVITDLLLTEFDIEAEPFGYGQTRPLPGPIGGDHQRAVVCIATPIR